MVGGGIELSCLRGSKSVELPANTPNSARKTIVEPYRKTQNRHHVDIDTPWFILDGEDRLVAITETETLADAVLQILRGELAPKRDDICECCGGQVDDVPLVACIDCDLMLCPGCDYGWDDDGRCDMCIQNYTSHPKYGQRK